MLNKKWIAGAVLGAFLSITAVTGSSEAEASAITAELQPTSDIVIVVDPFHDRYDRCPPPPPHYRHHPGPPPHRYKHHGPPPHHGKHHPRPHRR